MHCLGAVSGADAASPNVAGVGAAARGGVMSVVRALGVLVCEGRLQGPPRGYKEGPHCAAPLQTLPNDHACEKDNYLCARYLLLVREISERIKNGSSLSVAVLMCSDCPCGLNRATCNAPVPILPTVPISQWQHPSDILLEYWSISIVPSKSPETMNPQGLYQAVRSRLHFSQVAAWWSRSNGTKPSYVTSRIVTHSEDNLRKFREQPIEHTFPLAGIGDGNSIKVTVWALPRMEEVPILHCPLHPNKDIAEECAARALTPTKNCPLQSTTTHTVDNLVLPVLVDDRLQTDCDKPGKHHCNCEDDESSPPSPSPRPTGERKRRRSLPCGPSPETSSSGHVMLPSLRESSSPGHESMSNRPEDNGTNRNEIYENRSYMSTGSLERCFRKQVSLDSEEGNEEKRYKPSREKKNRVDDDSYPERGEKNLDSLVITWTGSDDNRETKIEDSGLSVERNNVTNASPRSSRSGLKIKSSPCTVHNPRVSRSSWESKTDETRNGPGKEITALMSKLSFPKEKKTLSREKKDSRILDWFEKVPRKVGSDREQEVPRRYLEETPNEPEVWKQMDIQRVLACRRGEPEVRKETDAPRSGELRLRNCNLELSEREFNEVLAVLRARTPTASRRRTPSKTPRRRIPFEKSGDDFETVCPVHREKRKGESSSGICDCKIQSTNDVICKDVNPTTERLTSGCKPADVLLGAILRTSRDRKGLADISNGTRPRNAQNELETKRIENGEEIEKSLPTVLNKRLSRFKQLFQKELEKRKFLASEGVEEPRDEAGISEKSNFVPGQNGVALGQNLRDLPNKNSILGSNNYNSSITGFIPESHNVTSGKREKTKRKIDFANFSLDYGKPEHKYEQFFNDAISETHQKITNSTNINRRPDIKKNSNFELFPKSSATPINGVSNGTLSGRLKKGEDSEEEVEKGVPSAIEQEQFRRSFENAASMVFHSRTGLPLTSSPAPLRRGHCCFDYDSTLNSVSSKRSALFELNTPPSPGAVSLEETDREIEVSGDGEETPKRQSTSRFRPQSHALLGSFEESALNGRLEPVSTVHGFTAEIGASGSFCPKHRKLPVTVFFYTLGDNDKVSTPYLAHINLGKNSYQVPRSGTIQVTLLNPLGTVVKMFVVLYDLSDMPPRSHTFLRQRTLRDKTLRYLVHLRFMSGKSGRIYLHTDIRMIICRKSDVDTASDFGSEPPKELRSYIHGPTNPKFSPRC